MFLIIVSDLHSAGPPNPNCMPFSACWCVDHPGHPACRPNNGVPINGGIEFLALAGLCLVFYYYRMSKKKDTKTETEPKKEIYSNCAHGKQIASRFMYYQGDE